MLRIFVTAAFSGLISINCHAAQEDWLANFAKKNAGKFSSELPELPKLVTVRSRPFTGWWTFSEYDQVRNMLTTTTAGSVWSEWIYERCQASGSYAGTSGLGVKATVTKFNCERLEIQDHDFEGISLRNLEISMNPQQYRDFKARGPIYEMDFEVGKGAKQEIASDDIVIDGASISKPTERKIRVLRVSGEMKKLRILSSDGKTVLTEIAR